MRRPARKSQTLRAQVVRVGEARGDFVAITDGLKEGETIVSTGVFKLRNGMAVVINNDLAPKPQLNPTPARFLNRRKASPTFSSNGQSSRWSLAFVILIAGLAGDEDAQCAAVSAQRHRRDHGHDRLRRCRRRTGAWIHHHAARASHGRSRWHRLHPVARASRASPRSRRG